MKKIIFIFIILLSFLFYGCEDKTTKKYTELNILTPNFDKKITGPIKKEAKIFEKENHTQINIISPSWEDMTKKIKESLEDDKINYDIFVVFSSWGDSLLSDKNAAIIPNHIKEKIQWDDVLPIYKENILKWNKKYYFLPYDGDSIMLYYRKDLFENSKYKKLFKEQYGYKLDVPKTWDEYIDIAKFFNGWDWDNDGKIEYGFAESRTKGYGTIFQFFTKAASYTKYPYINRFYFDDQMNPLINNEGFIKALDNFINDMKYAPPNIINYSPAEVRISFITGEVAMALDWADTGTMVNNAKESIVKGKVGYAELPGSNFVYNSMKKQWENFYNAPSSINGNWVIVVNKNSKNIDKAFDFAAHMTSKETTTKYIVKGESGINPSRFSHFSPPTYNEWIENGFTKKEAENYLKTISNTLNNNNVISDIKIPHSSEYYEVFDKYLNKAIKKELSVKESLDTIYNKWEEITNKYGRTNQIRTYKESINE